MKAVPGGPYSVRRGGRVEVDGSASKPKRRITSYVWEFKSDCPGGVKGKPSTKSGKTAKIVAVCETKATLTVSDGRSSDTKSATIKVTGKLRNVPFEQSNQIDTGNFIFDGTTGSYAFGFNRCAIEWAAFADENRSDHWLHKPDDGNDVATSQVSDPGGPYDGFFYVTDHNLLVTRQMITNSKLLPGGPVYNLNEAKHKKAIENIVDANIDHERIHGELARDKLRSKKLEFLDKLAEAVDTSEDGLQTRADDIVRGGETELKNASSEKNVKAKMAGKWGDQVAKILVPLVDGTSRIQPFTLAKVGDG